MLGRLLSRVTGYLKLNANSERVSFAGEPSGEGVEILKEELRKILQAEGNTSRAYLTKVQYEVDQKIRIALVIDGRAKAKRMASTIAKACQTLCATDLIFFEFLTPDLTHELTEKSSPFFIQN